MKFAKQRKTEARTRTVDLRYMYMCIKKPALATKHFANILDNDAVITFYENLNSRESNSSKNYDRIHLREYSCDK